MGHYYSEMHVPSPQEKWNEALDKSVRKMGYRKMQIEYKTFYICDWCGCLVTLLGQHPSRCPAGDKSVEIDRMIDRAEDMILGLDRPIELLKLVALASQNNISVYALNCAVEALVAHRKIIRQHNHTQPYQDTTIVPKEEPECLPES